MASYTYDSNGSVLWNNFTEYIPFKDDLKPISFIWSLIFRGSKQSQYFLGLISIWRITNDQVSSHCEAIHYFRLNFTQTSQPKLIKFGDFTSEELVLSVVYSDKQIIGYLLRITIEDKSGDNIIINRAIKLLWSVKNQTWLGVIVFSIWYKNEQWDGHQSLAGTSVRRGNQ